MPKLPKEIALIFDRSGEMSDDMIKFSKDSPFEETLIKLAEYYQDRIKPGHVLFLDFAATPKYEQPLIDYLIKGFGWKLEKPYALRKPKNQIA